MIYYDTEEAKIYTQKNETSWILFFHSAMVFLQKKMLFPPPLPPPTTTIW